MRPRPLLSTRRSCVLALALAGCSGCAPGEVETPRPAAPPPSGSETLPLPTPGDSAEAARLLQEAQQLRSRPGNKDLARDLYQRSWQADPTFLPTLLEYGLFLLETPEFMNHGRALELFNTARRLDPNQPLAICGAGLAWAGMDNFEAAEPALRESLERQTIPAPLRALTETSLARILFATGRPEEARGHFQAALQLQPGRAAFHVEYGLFLKAEGQRDAAEEAMRAALRCNPTEVTAHYQLYQLLLQRGAADEAARERRIHEILRHFVDHASNLYQQDSEKILTLRRELVEVYPEYERARLILIRELLQWQRHAEAEQELQIQIEQKGATAETHFLLARSQAGQGRLDAAFAALQAMRAADPKVPPQLEDEILEDWKNALHPDEATLALVREQWRSAR